MDFEADVELEEEEGIKLFRRGVLETEDFFADREGVVVRQR